MRIDMNRFMEKLPELFRNDPAGYAPFAFWKMRALCEDGEAFYLPECDCYYMIRQNHLLIYSSPDNRCYIPPEELNRLDCISMKADVFDSVGGALTGFDISYHECLFYDKSRRPAAAGSQQYRVVDFDFSSDAHYQLAADIINDSSGSDFFTPGNAKKMTTFTAFDLGLWFFVRDIESGELVAVGISTYHPGVRETDLDWIFVKKSAHGRGAGRFMIGEIIRRSTARSDVIRVGGTVEFYKRCGFYTAERWVWAAKPGYSFEAPLVQP